MSITKSKSDIKLRKRRYALLSLTLIASVATIYLLLRYTSLDYAVIALYTELTAESDVVTEGSAYGFTIGQSKEEVYREARRLYEGMEVYVSQIGVGKSVDYTYRNLFTFEEKDKSHYLGLDRWIFHFKYTRVNYIAFIFLDQKLVEIRMVDAFMELP